MDSVREGIGLVVVVIPDAVDTVKQRAPFETYDPVDREMYEEDMSVPACFSHLNLHIRADIWNNLRLCMPLRACDAELIRRAYALHPDDEEDDCAVVAMRRKLRREMIYDVQDHDHAPTGQKKPIPFPLATVTALSRDSDHDSDSDDLDSD